MIRRPPRSPLFPSTPLFRSRADPVEDLEPEPLEPALVDRLGERLAGRAADPDRPEVVPPFGVRHLQHRGIRRGDRVEQRDRKSTRLNSSHLVISYAVFCLKK